VGFIHFALITKFQNLAQISIDMVHNDKDRVQVMNGSVSWNNEVYKLWEEAHFTWHHFGQSFHYLNFSDYFD
jgi:sialic acid synthase SpsE